MWETQCGKFTTSNKVNVDLCLPDFSATKIVKWKCHVDESTSGIYDMILGRYLLTALVLDLKFSDEVIIGGEGPYERRSSPMVDVRNYNFLSITDKTVKPEKSLIKILVSILMLAITS